MNTGYDSRSKEVPMDIFTALIAFVVALVGIDVAAVRLGADSRDSIGDDHAR
jgi:hypothetical protein